MACCAIGTGADSQGVAGMPNEEQGGLERRQFLKKAAITTAGIWAVPVIQTVVATKAAAHDRGSPPPRRRRRRRKKGPK